jgi:hypothetical protein
VSGMEFTWRMVGTLIWPVVVLAGLIVYQPWITKKLKSLRLKAGGFEAEVKVLNDKVDTIGRSMAITLSKMPDPVTGNEGLRSYSNFEGPVMRFPPALSTSSLTQGHFKIAKRDRRYAR